MFLIASKQHSAGHGASSQQIVVRFINEWMKHTLKSVSDSSFSRLLTVPWTARRSNQSILKEINLEDKLEKLMLKLKLQYFGYRMQRADSWKRPWCWERLKAGGEGDDIGWDGWMASPTQWIWVWASSGRWWRTGKPGVLQSMECKELDTNDCLNNFCQKLASLAWRVTIVILFMFKKKKN